MHLLLGFSNHLILQGQVFFEGSDATVETVLLHAIEASETVAPVPDVIQLDPSTLRVLQAFVVLKPKPVDDDQPEPEPAPVAAPPPMEWACGMCTFVNPPDSTRCQVCFSDRPAPAVVPVPEPKKPVPADDGFGLRLLYLLLRSCALRALSVMLKHVPNVMCAVAENLHPKLLRDGLAPVGFDG